MSKLKVSALQGLSASSDAITLANDGTCTANITNNLSNRNLIINGAMQVAQRGTSSTTSGMHSVDRWSCNWSGGGVTQAQVSESSGTVFENGFHNYFRLTNTSNTTTDTDYRFIYQTIEAQNVVNSGWNFKSTSSYITFSFWVRSSLAGTYYTFLDSRDGTGRRYSFSYTLSADTWTKVTKTIPGASNIALNNDNGEGIMIQIVPWYGTYYTTSGHSLNTWHTGSSTDRTPDYSQNWANTSNATFDLTGVQLEVGSVATDFEHRSFAQELALCQRYFERINIDTDDIFFFGVNQFGGAGRIPLYFRATKRAIPTVTIDAASFDYYNVAGSGSNGSASFTVNSYSKDIMGISSSGAAANGSWWSNKSADGYVDASSEL
jgi:hypothetical protein